tara:strand:+ start:404 stop:637 length:234 start_codon:yes stop_codon:yes gene_type:complete
MKNFQIKSVFEQISTQVFIMTNVVSAKTYISNFLSETKINEIDKKGILFKVNGCRSMFQLQNYLCNSLLKYEGMSVN